MSSHDFSSRCAYNKNNITVKTTKPRHTRHTPKKKLFYFLFWRNKFIFWNICALQRYISLSKEFLKWRLTISQSKIKNCNIVVNFNSFSQAIKENSRGIFVSHPRSFLQHWCWILLVDVWRVESHDWDIDREVDPRSHDSISFL